MTRRCPLHPEFEDTVMYPCMLCTLRHLAAELQAAREAYERQQAAMAAAAVSSCDMGSDVPGGGAS